MQDEPFPAAERILGDIEAAFKKDPKLWVLLLEMWILYYEKDFVCKILVGYLLYGGNAIKMQK